MVSEAQKKATTKFEGKTYDKILLRIRKDGELTRDRIQSAADAEGKSLNAFITDAISAYIND